MEENIKIERDRLETLLYNSLILLRDGGFDVDENFLHEEVGFDEEEIQWCYDNDIIWEEE